MSSAIEELDGEEPSKENLRAGALDAALEESINDDPMESVIAPLWEEHKPLVPGEIPADGALKVLDLPIWP